MKYTLKVFCYQIPDSSWMPTIKKLRMLIVIIIITIDSHDVFKVDVPPI